MASTDEIKNRVAGVLAQIRPYLLEDGGDLELVDFENNTVYVNYS